jgi:DNA-directed RNA polymerase specialized sigma24 family protein
LATRLDTDARTRKPSHVTVLGLYCIQNLSIEQIAKKCGCAHGTVANRKHDLEKNMKLPLDAFRQHSTMLEQAAKAAEYGGARRVYRRGLME